MKVQVMVIHNTDGKNMKWLNFIYILQKIPGKMHMIQMLCINIGWYQLISRISLRII